MSKVADYQPNIPLFAWRLKSKERLTDLYKSTESMPEFKINDRLVMWNTKYFSFELILNHLTIRHHNIFLKFPVISAKLTFSKPCWFGPCNFY